MNIVGLIIGAIVAIVSFVFLNGYIKESLIKSNWPLEAAGLGALVGSILLIGIIFGVVTIIVSWVIGGRGA